MNYAPSISHIAGLIADPKRSALLWALIDGAARGADELADLAGVSSTSAGVHLSRLSAAGLLTREGRGRKRFFRLAAPEVGAAVEALANASVLSAHKPTEQALPEAPSIQAMRVARRCGEHLGGQLAGNLYRQMVEAGWLQAGCGQPRVTPAGVEAFAQLGIYVQALPQASRLEVTPCSGWCESGQHLGGTLGTGLLRLFLQQRWVEPVDDTRALRLTPAGEKALARCGLGVT